MPKAGPTRAYPGKRQTHRRLLGERFKTIGGNPRGRRRRPDARPVIARGFQISVRIKLLDQISAQAP